MKRTLLLSSNYVPIKVISWDAAIKLKYEGNADVVVEYSEEIRSPSTVWKLPAVMRVKRYVNPRRGVRYSPANVFLRDGFQCQYCGDHFDKHSLTIDHVVPRSRGGQSVWENAVAACSPCNGKKADRDCDACGMFPLRKPVRPKSLPTMVPQAPRGEATPDEWLAYL